MAKTDKKSKKIKTKNKEKGSKKAGKDVKKDKAAILAEARAKAKAGKGKKGDKKAKKTKKSVPTWKAPEDFKPYFVEVTVRTDKDGLLSNKINATRYQGKYDPQAPDTKKFDMSTYDQPTVAGILGRLSGTTFKTSAEKVYPADIKERNVTETFKNADGEKKTRLVHRTAKRLPANTTFKILLRAKKKSADDTLGVSVSWIKQGVKKASGVTKGIDLDKKDPAYRAIRKATKYLPAAFKDTVLPPKKSKKGNKKDADE